MKNRHVGRKGPDPLCVDLLRELGYTKPPSRPDPEGFEKNLGVLRERYAMRDKDNDTPTRPERRYPPLYEKIVPIALVIIVVIIVILLLIVVGVALGLSPGGA